MKIPDNGAIHAETTKNTDVRINLGKSLNETTTSRNRGGQRAAG